MRPAWFWGILVFGLLARVGFDWRFPARGRPGETIPDPDGYVTLARSFADTGCLCEGGKPSARREPVYPVLLGLAFKLFGTRYETVLLLNLIFGGLALALLYRIGARLFGEGAGLIGMMVGAVYPPFLYYGAQSYREILLVLLSLACVGSFSWALECKGRGGAMAAGAVNALAALTNTLFLPFGFLGPLGWFVSCRDWRDRAVRLAGSYAVAFVLVYSLWPIRNYLALKTWILGSSAAAGSTFYTYLVVPEELGGTEAQGEIQLRDPIFSKTFPDYVTKENYFWKAGLNWVREHPGRFLRLVAWRCVAFWRILPRPRKYEHSYRLMKWASLLTDGWIIPLGLAGIFLARLRPPDLLWVYLLIGSVDLVCAMYLVILRYRLPAMPWMILLATYTLREGWRRWGPRGLS